MHPNDVDGTANSADPDQTDPIGNAPGALQFMSPKNDVLETKFGQM